MKKTLLLLSFLLAMGNTFAGTANDKDQLPEKEEKTLSGKRKYQIVVSSLDKNTANMLNSRIGGNARGWAELGKSIVNSYKTVLTQKTVSATAGLIDLGVSLLSNIVLKNSEDFNEWIKIKEEQCTYKNLISTSQNISDFYYMHSTDGALDPHNLKFNGISCRNFIEVEDSTAKVNAKNTQTEDSIAKKKDIAPKNTNKEKHVRIGHDVYYISCKLRTDSLGAAHMTNHSKFYMVIDTLIFYPTFSNIPKIERYDTAKYTNLELKININIYSSWINEAAMVIADQKLGTFNISAKIDSDSLDIINGESVFLYHSGNKKNKTLVGITGDSFIVPRSFVGTNSNPLWGTGQYRIEMEVYETCQLNPNHYIKIEELGNVKVVTFTNLPKYGKWRKDIWKDELRDIKKRKKDAPVWEEVLTIIKTAYLGHNWVKEVIEPAVNPIYEHETKVLKDIFNLDDEKQKF